MAKIWTIRMDCLFALCMFVPAFGQTAGSEIRAAEPPQGGAQLGALSVRHLCTAVSRQPEGSAANAPVRSENVSTVAEHVSPCPSAAEQGQLAERHVAERLAVWQQRLKLGDWRISVAMTHRDDLKPKTLGGIRWDKPKKSAVIWVLDASDYRLPFREMLDDMELTIIHELVHLELASLPRSEASRSSEEHAVNGIAEALLRLDRQK